MGTPSVNRDLQPPPSPARAAFRERWRRPGSRAVFAWAIVPLAITLLAWHAVYLEPLRGVDPSWIAGLEMAVHNGIGFGTHAVFTFGPLGFLSYQYLWYASLGAASFGYVLAIRFAVALALFLGARRTFGGPIAFVMAVIVASVDDQLLEAVAFLIPAAWAITADLDRRRALGLSLAAGAFAGFELLNKISIGISLTAMTAVLVLSLPGRRRDHAAAAAGALVTTLIAFWLLTGQALSALPDYFKNSEQIVSGYAAAMSLSVPGLGWQYPAALLALALGLWGALHMTAGRPRRQRWGIALLWATFWFFAFKEGFVRHEPIHAAIFFEAVLGGFFAFRWRARHRLVALASAAALVTLALAAQGQPLTGEINLGRNLRTAIDQIRTISSPSSRNAITAAGRAAIKATEPIDAASLSLLTGHTVAVYPTEIALAWAYRLDWDPLPVLQSYSAYTTTLDNLDAAFLSSAHAPQRILIQGSPDIDERVLSFDQGRTSRMILCRYEELRDAVPLLVLGLSRNRCSTPVRVSTVHAGWGQTVSVPAPPNNHSLVFVRITGADVGGFERVKALLFKPAVRYVVLGGGPPRRFVPGTAADGLPLRASTGMDFIAPFNVAVDARSVAVLKAGQAPTVGGPLTYSFYVQTFDAGPVAQPTR